MVGIQTRSFPQTHQAEEKNMAVIGTCTSATETIYLQGVAIPGVYLPGAYLSV